MEQRDRRGKVGLPLEGRRRNVIAPQPASVGGRARTRVGRQLTISVIVPVHRCDANFLQCLASLVRSNRQADQIIVVADDDVASVRTTANEYGVKVVATDGRGGPAKARNVAARHAQGDILFFVDSDVAVHPDTIEQVLKAMADYSNVAAIIGSYDDRPTVSNFVSQYKNLFQHHVHQTASEEGFTFWGACGAIDRTVFEAMGGFDEDYRNPSIEDIELGYRLRSAGHIIRMCKDVQVTHLKRWTWSSLLRSDLWCRAVPWTQLILRARQFDDDLNIRTSSRLCVVMVFVLLLSLISSWWYWPASATVVGLSIAGLLICDLRLFRFFVKRRGLLFAARAIPYHWFYYCYSGVAFAIGVVLYFSKAVLGLVSPRNEPSRDLPLT